MLVVVRACTAASAAAAAAAAAAAPADVSISACYTAVLGWPLGDVGTSSAHLSRLSPLTLRAQHRAPTQLPTHRVTCCKYHSIPLLLYY